MPSNYFQIRQCQRESCGLRYPLVEVQNDYERCPRCQGDTRLVLERPLDREPGLTITSPSDTSPPEPSISQQESAPRLSNLQTAPILHVLLDNLRSAWNVGSIFRTADGAGVARLHLCGITPTPENTAVVKTSLGADKSIPWKHHRDGVAAANALLAQGCRLWALEGDPRARSIYGEENELPGEPLVLVVGNEVCGIDPGILDLCQRILYIPMQGSKRSLNVAVAFGIAAFTIRFSKPAADYEIREG